MLRSDLCGYSDAYFVVKGDKNLIKEIKILHLKTMHHLSIEFQKLMA